MAERAQAAYRCGQLLLRCPFDLAMDWGLPEQRLDLVCSTPRSLPASLQAALSDLDSPIIQVGFGGMGLELDPQLFSHWPDHHFLMACPPDPKTSARLALIANLTLLPAGVRPLDAFPFCEGTSVNRPSAPSVRPCRLIWACTWWSARISLRSAP